MARDLFAAGATVCHRTGEQCPVLAVGSTCDTIAPAIAELTGFTLVAPTANAEGIVPADQRGCTREVLEFIVPGITARQGGVY